MDNKKSLQGNRGSLLTGALVLSSLVALFNLWLSIETDLFTTPQLNDWMWWALFVLTVTNLYAFYCVFATFKMKKKGAIGLFLVAATSVIISLIPVMAVSDESAKRGLMFILGINIVYLLCSIISIFHLKKMN